MIALLGQTVRDEIRHPDGTEEVRCGGAPVFAASALAGTGNRGIVVTKGGDNALHADLSRRGLPAWRASSAKILLNTPRRLQRTNRL